MDDDEMFLHKYQLKQRWGKRDDDILEYVMHKGLKAYDDHKQILQLSYTEWTGVLRSQYVTGLPSTLRKETFYYPGETIKANMSYFKLADIRDFEYENELTPIKPELSTDNEVNMQEARRKGGRAKKINEVILEAVKQYILAKPNRIKESSELIAGQFTRKLKDQQYTKVTVNSRDYEVCFENEKISTFCNKYKKDKYHDKSISYSTFLRYYISEAKKRINGNIP